MLKMEKRKNGLTGVCMITYCMSTCVCVLTCVCVNHFLAEVNVES